jgi:hypothetical protein
MRFEHKISHMDRHEGYAHILNISGPPLEEIADLKVAAD